MQIELLSLATCAWRPEPATRPVIVYRNATQGADREGTASAFERRFAACGWPPEWRAGVFDYHHYHASTHEVLGIAGGWARLRLGGPDGIEATLSAGDVVALPAGTGHCRLEASPDFLVVGAYPPGHAYDLSTQPPDAALRRRIGQVPVPAQDPLQGTPRDDDTQTLPRLWAVDG